MALLRLGAIADIDAKDVNGWTALHYAAAYGSVQLVKVGSPVRSRKMRCLISAKIFLLCHADQSKKNNASYRPFEEAQARNRTEVVTMMTTFVVAEPVVRQRMNFLTEYYETRERNKQKIKSTSTSSKI